MKIQRQSSATVEQLQREIERLQRALVMAQYLTEHCAGFRWRKELGKPKWNFGDIASVIANSVKSPLLKA